MGDSDGISQHQLAMRALKKQLVDSKSGITTDSAQLWAILRREHMCRDLTDDQVSDLQGKVQLMKVEKDEPQSIRVGWAVVLQGSVLFGATKYVVKDVIPPAGTLRAAADSAGTVEVGWLPRSALPGRKIETNRRVSIEHSITSPKSDDSQENELSTKESVENMAANEQIESIESHDDDDTAQGSDSDSDADAQQVQQQVENMSISSMNVTNPGEPSEDEEESSEVLNDGSEEVEAETKDVVSPREESDSFNELPSVQSDASSSLSKTESQVRSKGRSRAGSIGLSRTASFEAVKEGRNEPLSGSSEDSLDLEEVQNLSKSARQNEADGHQEQAAMQYSKLVAILRSAGARGISQLGTALVNLGHCQAALGNAKEARIALREAVSVCEEQGDETDKALALSALAEVNAEQGDCNTALKLFMSCLPIFMRELGPVHESTLVTLFNISLISSQLDNPGPAAIHANTALCALREGARVNQSLQDMLTERMADSGRVLLEKGHRSCLTVELLAANGVKSKERSGAPPPLLGRVEAVDKGSTLCAGRTALKDGKGEIRWNEPVELVGVLTPSTQITLSLWSEKDRFYGQVAFDMVSVIRPQGLAQRLMPEHRTLEKRSVRSHVTGEVSFFVSLCGA